MQMQRRTLESFLTGNCPELLVCAKAFPEAHERDPATMILYAYPVQILPVPVHDFHRLNQGKAGIINMGRFRAAAVQLQYPHLSVGQIIQGSGSQVITAKIEFRNLPADLVERFVQPGGNEMITIQKLCSQAMV